MNMKIPFHFLSRLLRVNLHSTQSLASLNKGPDIHMHDWL